MKPQTLIEDLLLDKEIVFLAEGMTVDEEDLQLLNKWGFDKLSYKTEEDTSTDTPEENHAKVSSGLHLKIDQVRLKKTFGLFTLWKKSLDGFSQKLFQMINHGEPVKELLEQDSFKKVIDNLGSLSAYKDEFLLYLNTHLEEDFDNVTFYHAGLCILLGMETKCDEKNLKNIIFSSILSQIYFYQHPLEKIKRMLIKDSLNVNSAGFIKNKINYTLEQLKIVQLPKEIKYLNIYQHVTLDGSDGLGLKKELITVPAHILGVVDFYVWRRHPMSSQLFYESPHSPLGEILKFKDRFLPKVVNSFINVIKIYEIGSVGHFTSNAQKQLAIVLYQNDIRKKPIIKVVINHLKKVDYSRDLSDLNALKDVEYATVTKQDTIKQVQSIFLENIEKGKYQI